MVADGTAPAVAQSDDGASYEPALNKEELQMASILTKLFGNCITDISVVVQGDQSFRAQWLPYLPSGLT
jgi:hypothetical protein